MSSGSRTYDCRQSYRQGVAQAPSIPVLSRNVLPPHCDRTSPRRLSGARWNVGLLRLASGKRRNDHSAAHGCGRFLRSAEALRNSAEYAYKFIREEDAFSTAAKLHYKAEFTA